MVEADIESESESEQSAVEEEEGEYGETDLAEE
jgi:hypothetical protein